MKNQFILVRLGYALRGLQAAYRYEQSFRLQCMAAVAVIVTLLVVRPAPFWWALLLLNCGLVLAAELFNTALEHALDRLHPERHSAIQIAKDCSAGAVLCLSVIAVIEFIIFIAATVLSY